MTVHYVYHTSENPQKIKCTYHLDSHGRLDGTCTWLKSNGDISYIYSYRDGVPHGEDREYDSNGKLTVNSYFVNDELIADLIETPLSDVEKFELQLIHGAPWL